MTATPVTPEAEPRWPEDALAAALPIAAKTAWAVAGYPPLGPDPTYWERFAHGVIGVLERLGFEVRAATPDRLAGGLDVETRRALSDKGVAFGFQEAADVAREMGSDAIADALRTEGIRRYAGFKPLSGLADEEKPK